MKLTRAFSAAILLFASAACKDDGDDDRAGSANSPAGAGSEDDGSGSSADEPVCATNDECGLSFDCLACRPADTKGWCVHSERCESDSDCGNPGKCGHNVETDETRCIPSSHCK